MKTLFITGTGTEIGKTYITAALTRALVAKGAKVRPMKPVVSGYPGDDAQVTDTGILIETICIEFTPEALNFISPWRYALPLSPDMAATREGWEIDFDELVQFCRDAGNGPEDVLLCEGIGGVMVPIDGKHTVLDWITEWRVPVLLVAGSYLGTLSHTLSTVAAMQARGVEIAGVVVDESEESPVPVAETVETLERHLKGIPVAAVARNAPPEAVLAALEGMIGA